MYYFFYFLFFLKERTERTPTEHRPGSAFSRFKTHAGKHRNCSTGNPRLVFRLASHTESRGTERGENDRTLRRQWQQRCFEAGARRGEKADVSLSLRARALLTGTSWSPASADAAPRRVRRSCLWFGPL